MEILQGTPADNGLLFAELLAVFQCQYYADAFCISFPCDAVFLKCKVLGYKQETCHYSLIISFPSAILLWFRESQSVHLYYSRGTPGNFHRITAG